MEEFSNCLFCKIANKEIKAYVVYETEHAMAFLDVKPRAKGHVVVIPRVHAATMVKLPAKEVEPLFLAVQHVAEMIMERIKPDGITIGMNQGRASGQEVDHLHVHLIPRWQDDRGSAIQSVVNNPPKDSIDAVHKAFFSRHANGTR